MIAYQFIFTLLITSSLVAEHFEQIKEKKVSPRSVVGNRSVEDRKHLTWTRQEHFSQASLDETSKTGFEQARQVSELPMWKRIDFQMTNELSVYFIFDLALNEFKT